ncbi:Nuclear transcription factor Y subunit C-2 [Vanrija pseudolonga]|uniref:Nuclear transcription factor Y subunit C-2 n=1 Tax=Vanrija pseudolonga TaxID=143232 RepID=A0AAF0Y1N2_9TREE|nr:Nuclear transcription factor Y subunit C-2 [Vanrija pseudolonga]
MNTYYLSEGLYPQSFSNGTYSSPTSNTSSPATGAAGTGVGIMPSAVGGVGSAALAQQQMLQHVHAQAAAQHQAAVHHAQMQAAAASSSAAAAPPQSAAAASAPPLTGPLVHPHQDLNDFLESFWTRQMDGVERETPDFKTYNLPLARIKKVMKSDEEVKMISAEAPIMFSKACEIFISELTCRAWLVAEGHKRRTLQKSDVAAAIAFSDVFDFLIDIVPRDGEEAAAGAAPAAPAEAAADGEAAPQGGAGDEWAPDAEYADDAGGDVYDYDDGEGRDGEALYSEYVQGEGEAFG